LRLAPGARVRFQILGVHLQAGAKDRGGRDIAACSIKVFCVGCSLARIGGVELDSLERPPSAGIQRGLSPSQSHASQWIYYRVKVFAWRVSYLAARTDFHHCNRLRIGGQEDHDELHQEKPRRIGRHGLLKNCGEVGCVCVVGCLLITAPLIFF
jgi:hypothetical protein